MLADEGHHVTRRMLDHAVRLGVVTTPAKNGNWRQWNPDHVEAVRAYLRDHARPRAGDNQWGDA
jgi:hypothetical protein